MRRTKHATHQTCDCTRIKEPLSFAHNIVFHAREVEQDCFGNVILGLHVMEFFPAGSAWPTLLDVGLHQYPTCSK